MKYEIIPIVFSANEFFVPYMAATIQSVMENANQHKQYRFFILHQGISGHTQEIVRSQVSCFPHFSIEFINVEQYTKNYTFFTANKGDLTSEAYFRLLIPELFSEYEKVIYLDCDLVCLADIAELYEMDLGNNVVAASRDFGLIVDYYCNNENKTKNYKKHPVKSEITNGILQLRTPENYFNSGVLVFNVAHFNKTISTKLLLDTAISKNWKWHDQDVLNVLCEQGVFFLPYTWNFIFDTKKDTNQLPTAMQNEHDESQKALKIIHFAGQKKPWLNMLNMPFFDYFWKYATRTSFIAVIVARMNEKKLIQTMLSSEYILYNIKHRQGFGLLFILQCLKAWLFREKK